MSNKSESRSRFDRLAVQSGVPQQRDALDRRDDGGAVSWRFHRNADRQWRWERIPAAEGVTRQSSSGFARYEECVRNAEAAGYKRMAAAPNLVPLCLGSDPQAIPQVLNFDIAELPGRAKRSTVLKKRVAHPAIERIFGKGRSPTTTAKRTKGPGRLQVATFASSYPHARVHGKTRLNRA
ncbi:MAG: hypothetical protein ACXWCY_00950 [Burkholderiales bacterium]